MSDAIKKLNLAVKSYVSSLKSRTGLLGLALGLMLGAGGVSMAMAGLKQQAYDGAEVVQVADIAPIKPPMGAPMSFAPIVERVSPAVVAIETKGKAKGNAGIPNIPGFDFGDSDPNKKEPEREVMGAGSGFFISSDGYIVTNNHVIEGADEIKVKLSNDKKLTARVIGRDTGTDLAVLKVEGSKFAFVTFELKNKPRVGDWVLAVGNPFGLSSTVTAGIVSAFGRSDGASGYVDYLQIDAPINRGNSGGPTFDLYGRVIGVNTAIITPSGASAGIGFAIPADIAYNITSKLIKGGKVERGFIGVVISPVTDETAEALGIKDTEGAFVAEVTAGGPADKAGIQVGDIVKVAGGQPVKTNTDLTRRIANVREGEKVSLTVLRNGKLLQIVITSGLRPSDEMLARGEIPDGSDFNAPEAQSEKAVLGLNLKPLSPLLRKTYKLSDEVQGLVVINMDMASDVAKKGVKIGDVVVRADNRPLTSRDDLIKIVDELNKQGRPSILLLINQGGRNFPVPVALK
jgi:serine protease Do